MTGPQQLRPSVIEAIRWAIVALYVAFTWALCADGTSATDFGCIVVVGMVALVLAVSLDWINRAPRRER